MFVNREGNAIKIADYQQEVEAPAEEAPGFTETLGAAFRQENIIGSYFSRQTTGIEPNVIEEGYNPWTDIVGSPYEDYWDRFADVHNSRYANALKSQIDQEKEDRRTIGAAGWKGFVASMGAGVADIPTLLPGGVVVKGGKAVTASRLALSTAAAGALDASVSELALQQSQETRGYTESMINIGASTILSGLVGGAVGRYVGKAEMKRLQGQLEQDLGNAQHVATDDMEEAFDAIMEGRKAGVGAEAADILSADDLAIKGRAAEMLGSVAPFNPMVGLSRSSSRAARQVAADLPEMGYALKMTGRGGSQPQAVETYTKQWTLGAMGQALEQHNDIFKAYRQQGGQLNRAEFNARAGNAMRTDDLDIEGDDFISRTAAAYRKAVFDPLKKEAIDGGLLPEDVDVSTASSYFTRLWNRNKIDARRSEFSAILRRHYQRTIDDLVAKGEYEYANKAELESDLEEAVRATVDKLTGREVMGDESSLLNLVPVTRGPLKERTLNIPDEEVREFLENDIELVGRQYARIMAADVELQRKFGRADMRDQIAEVKRDYDELRTALEKRKDVTPEQRERQLLDISKQETKDLVRVQGMRDRLRGTHMLDASTSSPARFAQAAQTFNYLRTMGGVTLSSLSDVGRHAMVHGFRGVMQDGIKPLLTNLKGVKLSRADAKMAGAIAESIHNTRMATMADLTDPYAFGHPAERFLNNAATGFSKITGMPYWNDFQKSFAGQLAQARILRGAEQAVEKGFDSLPKKEQSFLAQLGLGKGDLENVGEIYRQFGYEEGGMKIANLERWGNEGRGYEMRRLYMAALNKAVDTTIVTKGIGDTPLALDHPLGRAIFQFKSFALASHQRVLMRAAQDAGDQPIAVLTGMSQMVAIGSFLYWLKSIESGRDVSDNPGKWIAEGVDRSGLVSVLMEFNNMAEKVGAPGLYSVAQATFPEKDQGAPASRYAIRSTVGSYLGPSFGLATDIAQLAGLAGTNLSAATGLREEGQPITKGDINAGRRLLPGSTLPIIRSLLEHIAIPAAEEALVQ